MTAEAGAGLEVGSWTQRGLATRDSLFPHVSGGLRGRTLKVTSVHVSAELATKLPISYPCPRQYPPWHTIIRDEAGTPVHFGGFIPEILTELSVRLNFTYDLVEPRDGSWEGMIQLVEEEVRTKEVRNFLSY